MGWKLLGFGVDPLPGDPVVVRQGGGEYIAEAERLSQVVLVLRGLDAGASRAPSVMALLERLGDVADDLTVACNDLRAVGHALEDYAVVLDRVQTEAAGVYSMARPIARDADEYQRLAGVWQWRSDEAFMVGDIDNGLTYAHAARTHREDATYERTRLVRLREAIEQYINERDAAANTAIAILEEHTRTTAATQAVLSTLGAARGNPAALSAQEAALALFLLATSATPEDIHTWFTALAPLTRLTLIHAFPDALRNLDGIPPQVRDRLNRKFLARELARLRATQVFSAQPVHDGLDSPYKLVSNLSPEDRRLLADLEAIEATLTENHNLDQNPFLLGLDTSDRAYTKAIVALGDITTADYVAPFVGGMTTTVRGSIMSYAEHMRNLKEECEYLLDDAGRGGESVATVVWIGYHAPQLNTELASDNSVALENAAREGIPALQSFTAGVRATGKENVDITLIGHSYGSLLAAGAVQEATHGANRVIVAGTPGAISLEEAPYQEFYLDGPGHQKVVRIPVHTEMPFYLEEGSVYHLENARDPVDDLGWFGTDYSHLSNVTQLSTSAFEDMHGTTGHSSYFDKGSTSLRNMAAVVVNMPEHMIPTENVDDRPGWMHGTAPNTHIDFKGEQ